MHGKMAPEPVCAQRRIALFGQRRYGFFDIVPVGATNVGSTKVSFDSVSSAPKTPRGDNRADPHFLSSQPPQALRINVHGHPPPPGTYTECLGGTVVFVFGVKPRPSVAHDKRAQPGTCRLNEDARRGERRGYGLAFDVSPPSKSMANDHEIVPSGLVNQEITQ